jgi:Spy/CpxP family protein refolding chaperone
MTDKLSTRLKLTNDQSGSIQKLLSDKISYARELRSKDLISKSEIKAKRKEFRDGINKILTKKQQKKFHKMMKKQFRKHHRHHHKILGLF